MSAVAVKGRRAGIAQIEVGFALLQSAALGHAGNSRNSSGEKVSPSSLRSSLISEA